MKLLLLIFLLPFSGYSSEYNTRKFCEDLVEFNTKKEERNQFKITTSLILKAIFAPRKFVDMRKIEKNSSYHLEESVELRKGGNIVAFVNLKAETFTKSQKNELHLLEESEDRLKNLFIESGLKKKLNTVVNIDSCMSSVRSFSQSYHFSFKKYEDLLIRKKQLVEIKEAKITYDTAIKKLSFLEKKGVKVFVNWSYSQIFQILNKGNINTAIFIGHSNNFGDLYFGKEGKERLPANFFDVLKFLPGDLIFFSCNGNSVIKKYMLQNIKSTVYFSFIDESQEDLFGEKVPFVGLLSIKKNLKKKNLKNTIIKKTMLCSFVASIHTKYPGKYILRINNEFIYTTQIEDKVINANFPCKYLDKKVNKIKVANLNGDYLTNSNILHNASVFNGKKNIKLTEWKSLRLKNDKIMQLSAEI